MSEELSKLSLTTQPEAASERILTTTQPEAATERKLRKLDKDEGSPAEDVPATVAEKKQKKKKKSDSEKLAAGKKRSKKQKEERLTARNTHGALGISAAALPGVAMAVLCYGGRVWRSTQKPLLAI
eukprot:gnl/TRDRNA2_/TRDRNA2_47326_c0_seq1.p2 gnl/TRDRNA2_/TRDRNA2_47326_c0~~gnl/TRDRNA2_/TRDRNA2_47326_c0_seq1.p2  ORF type:complete len:126 (-),score=38.01 gnl/TRDRNA2_/TRDRNA2_47326_c0_seq1:117-494(-)